MNTKQLMGTVIGTIIKVVIAAVIIMYVYKGVVIAYDFGYRVFAEEPVSAKPGITYTVTITEGKSVKDIGAALQEYGLIRDAKLFYAQNLLSEYRGKLEPGVYQLNTSMTAEEMMVIMAGADEAGTETETEETGSDNSSETTGETATSMETQVGESITE